MCCIVLICTQNTYTTGWKNNYATVLAHFFPLWCEKTSTSRKLLLGTVFKICPAVHMLQHVVGTKPTHVSHSIEPISKREQFDCWCVKLYNRPTKIHNHPCKKNAHKWSHKEDRIVVSRVDIVTNCYNTTFSVQCVVCTIHCLCSHENTSRKSLLWCKFCWAVGMPFINNPI